MSSRYVVGVDGSEHSRRALEWAVREAASAGAEVEAVLSWQFPLEDRPFGPTIEELDRLEARWSDTLDQAIGEVDADGLGQPVGRSMVAGAHAGRALVERAADADLLVVGTRGRGGFASLLLGSVAEHCLHHSPCPTAFVPPRPLPETDDTVVGVDGSDESQAALRWAAARATSAGGEVTALYSWNWIDQPKEAQYDTDFDDDDAMAYLEGAVASSGVDRDQLTLSVVNDLPSKAILDAGADAGLIVLGSHGRNLAQMLLTGSVARQVAHHTPVPLVVHR